MLSLFIIISSMRVLSLLLASCKHLEDHLFSDYLFFVNHQKLNPNCTFPRLDLTLNLMKILAIKERVEKLGRDLS